MHTGAATRHPTIRRAKASIKRRIDEAAQRGDVRQVRQTKLIRALCREPPFDETRRPHEVVEWAVVATQARPRTAPARRPSLISRRTVPPRHDDILASQLAPHLAGPYT